MKNEMHLPKVSIILPIYNVQKYLKECLQSIENQTYKNIEIIMINDCSSDSSPDIINKWADGEKYFAVHKSRNEGLGFARNTGLKHVSGDFVMFIDSDDFIETNMVEKLMDQVFSNNCDTVFCGYTRYLSSKRTSVKLLPFETGTIFNNLDTYNYVLLNMLGAPPSAKDDIIFPMSVWHGVYSFKIIKENGIQFPSERQFISEDIFFHIDYLSSAEAVGIVNEPLYYYRLNDSSLTQGYVSNRFEKQIILYKELRRRLNTRTIEENVENRLSRFILGRFRNCLQEEYRYYKTNDPRRLHQRIRNMVDNPTIRKVIKKYEYSENPIQLRIFNYFVEKKFVVGLLFLHFLRGKKNDIIKT